MYSIQADNIGEVYKEALGWLMDNGQSTKPRGLECREMAPVSLTLTLPRRNILVDPIRKINLGFAAAEFLWIIDGRNDVEWIKKFNSRIAEYSDDGKTFYGAYGPRFVDQLAYVKKCLTEDEWTRQAVMTFWQTNPPKTKDVPCTVMLHFMRRPTSKLNLIVYMRSNDVWLGLPYDIHNFTSIQMMIAEELGLEVGTYTHIDGSLHLYESDFEKAKQCRGFLYSLSYGETLPKYVIAQKRAIAEEYLKRKEIF